MMHFVFAATELSKSKAFFDKEEGFREACSFQDKQNR